MSYASEQGVLNSQWNAAELACQAEIARMRPSVLYRPRLVADGTMWIALLGDDLQVGISGCGETPAEAMADFDKSFETQRTPAAVFAARTAS